MQHGLKTGVYRTENGSVVRISGGRSEIDFDWFEEGACIDADVWVQDGELVWECECCGVFSKPLLGENDDQISKKG